MKDKDLNNQLEFFVTKMPDSRPADYYLGCFEGSVFMDFNNHENGSIYLKRISFDGYGCCELKDQAMPMNEFDSKVFKEIIAGGLSDQPKLTIIVKKTILNNREHIWEDALNEYDLA